MLGRLRPRPVDPEVQLIGELSDGAFGLALPIEEALRRQHPGHEQRRIDRRQLRIRGAMSGSRVEEMIEKSFVAHDPLRLRDPAVQASRNRKVDSVLSAAWARVIHPFSTPMG